MGDLNAFYWYQTFALDSAVVKAQKIVVRLLRWIVLWKVKAVWTSIWDSFSNSIMTEMLFVLY